MMLIIRGVYCVIIVNNQQYKLCGDGEHNV